MPTTHVDEKLLRELWATPILGVDLAARLKVTQSSLYWLKKRYNLPDRPKHKRGTYDDDAPTPEEIRQRCLETQAKWSEEERERRIVGRSAEVRMKAYAFNHRDFAFSAMD